MKQRDTGKLFSEMMCKNNNNNKNLNKITNVM